MSGFSFLLTPGFQAVHARAQDGSSIKSNFDSYFKTGLNIRKQKIQINKGEIKGNATKIEHFKAVHTRNQHGYQSQLSRLNKWAPNKKAYFLNNKNNHRKPYKQTKNYPMINKLYFPILHKHHN